MTMAGNGHDIFGRVEALETSVEELQESSHAQDGAVGALTADISGVRKVVDLHHKEFRSFRDTPFKAMAARVDTIKSQSDRTELKVDYLVELSTAVAKAVGIDPKSIHPPRDSLVDQVEAVGDRVETVEKRVARVARARMSWGKIAKIGAAIAFGLGAVAAAINQLASVLSGH